MLLHNAKSIKTSAHQVLLRAKLFFILCCGLLLISCGSGPGNGDIEGSCTLTANPEPIQDGFNRDFFDVGVAQWPDFLSNITLTSNQPFDPRNVSVREVGSIAGLDKFHGGVLGLDGNVYFIPSSASSVYYLDVTTLSLQEFGNVGNVANAWSGGVLAPNGNIYSFPWTEVNPRILEINTSTRSIRLINVASGGYGGQILAPNGKIYGIPDNATAILEFDPSDDSTNYITVNDGSLDGARKFFGGALAPNGNIYGVPLNATSVLKFNPVTQEISYIGSVPSTQLKWAGAVLAPNGVIYAVPDDASQALMIDTNTDSLEYLDIDLGSAPQKWSFGVLAVNGRVYFIPDDASQFLELIWQTGEIRLFGDYVESDKWNGAVMAHNGKFYTVPDSSARVLEIDLCVPQTFHPDVLLSTYFNRY